MDDEQATSARPARLRSAAWLCVVVAVAVAARLPSVRFPLDQDAAVYTYAAERWLEGGLPYRDAWDHKPPFIFLIYAGLFSIAEVSPVPLRMASALCDGATLVLVYLLGRRLFRPAVGLWAALVYGVFTAGPALQYEAFQPEHVMMLFVTAAMLAALVYAETQRLRYAALCGVLFGLALAAKQTAAPLGVFVWVWVTWEALRRDGSRALGRVVGHSLLLLVGVLVPWAVFAAYFKARGAFDEFWFCTYTYNRQYAVEDRAGGFVEGAVALVKSMAHQHAFLWLTGAAGVAAALARRRWRAGIGTGAWAGCGFLSVVIPGQASPYYFIQTIVPLALAGGLTLAALRDGVKQRGLLEPANVLAALVLVGLLAVAAKRELAHCRAAVDPSSGNRVAVAIGRYLGERTRPGERLYVWGSRPQVYVAARRQGICPYLYNFSYNMVLDEPASARQGPRPPTFHFRKEKLDEIMRAVRKHRPRFIVATETQTLGKFAALREYLDAHYSVQSADGFRHEWPTSSRYVPLIRVFRRKGS